jgi:hypothetical protein
MWFDRWGIDVLDEPAAFIFAVEKLLMQWQQCKRLGIM